MRDRLFRKSLVIGIIILFVGAGFVASISSDESTGNTLSGNTLYVGGSGPGNYSTIQNAIDDASSGDTVFVYSGIYYENLLVIKSINLIGEDRITTIIDGNNLNDTILIATNLVKINGFTIRNSGSYLYGYFGGINIISGGNTIEDNVISNNQVGILIETSGFNTIKDNIFEENAKYAIYSYHYAKYNIITNNFIRNNWGGIILGDHLGYAVVENNTISNNTFELNQIDIQLWFTRNDTISNNTIIKNIPTIGGITLYGVNNTNVSDNIIIEQLINGLQLTKSCNNIIYNNTILNCSDNGISLKQSSNDNFISKNNVSSNKKFGIQIIFSTIPEICKNNTIHNNKILDNQDGGIKLRAVINTTISNNTIYGNRTNIGWTGDGIRVLSTSNTTFSGNKISYHNTGILFSKDSTYPYDNYDNNITCNNISRNQYGVDLYNCHHHVVYNNYFANMVNAIMHLGNSQNKWNVSKKPGKNIINGPYIGGNFWDDYNGIDINRDGIGDTGLPYNCSGKIVNGGDYYPLVPPQQLEYVCIVKPEPKGGYVFDERLFEIPFFEKPIIVGPITIEVMIPEDILGMIKNLIFFIDDEVVYNDDEKQFRWLWDETVFGRHNIKVVAFDKYEEEIGIDEIDVWIFNI